MLPVRARIAGKLSGYAVRLKPMSTSAIWQSSITRDLLKDVITLRSIAMTEVALATY
jgi:hypothetical protein